MTYKYKKRNIESPTINLCLHTTTLNKTQAFPHVRPPKNNKNHKTT